MRVALGKGTAGKVVQAGTNGFGGFQSKVQSGNRKRQWPTHTRRRGTPTVPEAPRRPHPANCKPATQQMERDLKITILTVPM